MPRHVDFEINIELGRVRANEIGIKEDYFKTIQDRYLGKYLENLGVEPTSHHKAAVARHAPLSECEIEATWQENSSVASRLRIVQPQIGAGIAGAQAQDGVADSYRSAEWKGIDRYVNVLPPDVHVHQSMQRTMPVVESDQASIAAKKAAAERRALQVMQLRDLAASKSANFALTAELERVRSNARYVLEESKAKADEFGKLLKKKDKREADEQELETLKSKFILPFACELLVKLEDDHEMLVMGLPWQSPEFQVRQELQVPAEFMAEARQPIAMLLDTIREESVRYALYRFPVDLLTTREDPELFAAVRGQLASEEAVRITGLIAHSLYWTVLGHVHEPAKRLPEPSKQSLLMTIQELWSMIQEPARKTLGRRGELLSKDGPAGISFVIPAFMLAIKRGVEWVFQQEYPWIFKQAGIKRHLIDQLNVKFMRLFDPDCIYASFGALEASTKAIKLWHKLSVLKASMGITPATRITQQEYRTTPLMALLMRSDGGAPLDPKTRRWLAKSSSDPTLSSQVQQRRRAPPDGAPLDDWRRATLFRSASRRLIGLQRSGMEQVKGGKPRKSTTGNFMRKAAPTTRSETPSIVAT